MKLILSTENIPVSEARFSAPCFVKHQVISVGDLL